MYWQEPERHDEPKSGIDVAIAWTLIIMICVWLWIPMCAFAFHWWFG